MWNVRKDHNLNFVPRIIDSGKKNEKVNVVGVAGKINVFYNLFWTLESKMIEREKESIPSGRAKNATQSIWNCYHSESK